MDPNIAAWMMAGGPHVQTHAQSREREQLLAFREGQRVEQSGRPSLVARIRSLVARIRSLVQQAQPVADLDCCPA